MILKAKRTNVVLVKRIPNIFLIIKTFAVIKKVLHAQNISKHKNNMLFFNLY